MPIQIVWVVFSLIILHGCASICFAEEIASAIKTEPEQIENFWDSYYSSLGEDIHRPIIWFDNFFGDPRTEDEELPASFIRVRSAVAFTEGEGLAFPIRIHANIQLPKASRRLRLIVTGENEEDLIDARADSSAAPGVTTLQNQDTTNLGLRYVIYKTLRSKLHFGGGLRLHWPVESYLRMRYLRIIHIGRINLIRFTETGFWHSIDGFGETTRIDFERTLSKNISVRLSTFGTHSEISEGVDWGVETSLFTLLTPKSALSYDLGAYGHTRPHTVVDTYRIGTRYRRNILRPWLFFEIEPELRFVLNETQERDAVGTITFRLEVQFISDDNY